MSDETVPAIHLAEGGFLPRPERKAESDQRDEEIRPLAISQPGFLETYGGPIPGTEWGFFTAKFDSLENMERWQANRIHNQVQDEARERLWKAYFVRKGRMLEEQETSDGLILCETVILRDARLSAEEEQQAESACASVSEFPVRPYETLTGKLIPTPYVFSGPVGVAPQRAPTQYVLLTYWDTTTDCDGWRASAGYHSLADLGEIHSSRFTIIPERRSRMGLRPDRLQREWVASDAGLD